MLLPHGRRRILAAVTNNQCATALLPPNMLGQAQTFTIQFSP
jgi:hypothetical protein